MALPLVPLWIYHVWWFGDPLGYKGRAVIQAAAAPGMFGYLSHRTLVAYDAVLSVEHYTRAMQPERTGEAALVAAAVALGGALVRRGVDESSSWLTGGGRTGGAAGCPRGSGRSRGCSSTLPSRYATRSSRLGVATVSSWCGGYHGGWERPRGRPSFQGAGPARFRGRCPAIPDFAGRVGCFGLEANHGGTERAPCGSSRPKEAAGDGKARGALTGRNARPRLRRLRAVDGSPRGRSAT